MWLLADAARREPMPPGGRVLALGAGTSVVGIAGARAHRMQLTVVAGSRRGRLSARLNGAVNGVHARAPRRLAPDSGFDLIVVAPGGLSSKDGATCGDCSTIWSSPRSSVSAPMACCSSCIPTLWDIGATITLLVRAGLSTEVAGRSEPWRPGRLSEAAIVLRARRE